MSDIVVPFRARDVPVDRPAEALDHLEEQARRYFRSPLEAAFEATWQEATRRGFRSMSFVTLVLMMNRALKKKTARFPPG